MHELCRKVASFVKAHPGLRIELINKELGTATKELALPIRKLLADRVITSKGEKRATMYFPGRKSFKG
jgi:predicted transcriptional regulator